MEENKILRNRLRELGIKIADLSRMLNISRPTLYKIIESYEAGRLENLEASHIQLCHYITQNKFINANNVMIFISEHILSVKEGDSKKVYITGSAEKDAFIQLLLESSRFDCAISYLLSCAKLLEARDKAGQELNQESRAFLQPLERLYQSLGLTL